MATKERASKDRPKRWCCIADTQFRRRHKLTFANPSTAEGPPIRALPDIWGQEGRPVSSMANIRHALRFVKIQNRYGAKKVDRRSPRMSILFPGSRWLNKDGHIVVPHVQRFGMLLSIEWVRFGFVFLPHTLIAYVDQG